MIALGWTLKIAVGLAAIVGYAIIGNFLGEFKWKLKHEYPTSNDWKRTIRNFATRFFFPFSFSSLPRAWFPKGIDHGLSEDLYVIWHDLAWPTTLVWTATLNAFRAIHQLILRPVGLVVGKVLAQ
ncbi:MAG: hypothetical protein WC246_00495 [Candidatus Paceibacterota bacterium]|jgi:hypothetical protein